MRVEGLTEVAQAAHERILSDEEGSAAPIGTRPTARICSFQGSGDVPSDPPLTRGLPAARRNPTRTPRRFSRILEPRGYSGTYLIREPDDAIRFEEASVAGKAAADGERFSKVNYIQRVDTEGASSPQRDEIRPVKVKRCE
jgi:hypothetical protein